MYFECLILIDMPFTLHFTGLELRVRNENLIILFLNQNICCGYSKEPSQWDKYLQFYAENFCLSKPVFQNQDNDTLKELLKSNIEKPVKMTVYSSKTQSVRDVSITPSHNWGGQGLLGVSIRLVVI